MAVHLYGLPTECLAMGTWLVEGELIKFVCSRRVCAFRSSCSLIIVVWF
jgi:hypothetical protein